MDEYHALNMARNRRNDGSGAGEATPGTARGLDDLDRAILERLQDDGRITNAALAKAVGISPTSTLARVRRLERDGVIRSYAALIDADAVGQPVTALTRVRLRQHGARELDAFKRAIGGFGQVQACWHLAGDDDFVLKIVASDLADYERFVTRELSALENLGQIRTSICLSTVKDGTRVPLRGRGSLP